MNLLNVVTFLENVRHKIDKQDVHTNEDTFKAFKLILDAEHAIQRAAMLLNFEY